MPEHDIDSESHDFVISPGLFANELLSISTTCNRTFLPTARMPPKGLSQPGPSQSSMKQKSISSFFTSKSAPKTATTSNGVQSPPVLRALPTHIASPISRNASTTSKREHVQEAVDAGDNASGRKRRRITEDDEDESDDGEDTVQDTSRSNATGEGVIQSAGAEKDGPGRTTGSARTSKYLFSSSPILTGDGGLSQEQRRQKELLHQRFVKKLGRPDSLAEIKRRNNAISEDTPEGEAAEEEDLEDEDEPPSKSKKGKNSKIGPGAKLTPMERQYLEIKRKHLDTIIAFEVGYKFRFFGEDARLAARELSIFCIPGKFRYDEHPSEAHLTRFASASFPIGRLHVHVKRLVTAGHKVGVVRQIETAALKKVGDNRNAPFVRKLTNVYTKGTYVDDVEGLDSPAGITTAQPSTTGYLLCLTESNLKIGGDDEKVHVGFIAVQPATGSIIYDDFEDGFMRSEIETRILHIAPCEYLIVGELSNATQKLVKHLSGSKSNVFGVKARMERVGRSKTMAAEAYSHVSTFYADKMQTTGDAETDEHQTHILDKVHQLSEHVTVCLSAMIKHLTEYGLEHIFDLTPNFQSFSARTHMLLNGNTLNSLEIYTNQTDHSERGSLFWTLDRTKTRFGRRLLRNWVGRPLLDKTQLERRIEAVDELNKTDHSKHVDRLTHVLASVKSDLEKILIRIYYKRAARSELLAFLQTMQRISGEYSHVKNPADAGFNSSLINEACAVLPAINNQTVEFLGRIRLQPAMDDDKYAFFREEFESEAISDHKLGIAAVEHELGEHRAAAAQKLGRKKVEYVTVAGIEYLIEVENTKTALSKVPASWVKISNTKKCSRFHTPEVIKLLRERDQNKESLAAACEEAFTAFLTEISGHYQALRDAIQSLALLDCLVSLADVATQPGYTKPIFASDSRVAISQGRHPMVEQLLLDSYVPNDIRISSTEPTNPSALLITGPNMGGKSSYVRSVALISIMGQIGSFVPAEHAELAMLDAVFTRMGAFDNMMRGESTFMVELSETSDILKHATPRSLVILDELGRGTSTHDGVAIAEAVIRELLDRKVMTLFITHYQDLARLQSSCAGLRNVHMKFTESGNHGEEEITFLYEVGDGVAHRSYG